MRHVRSLLPGLAVLTVALATSGVLRPPQLEGLPTTPLLTLVLVPVLRSTMFASGAMALGGAALLLLGGGARVARIAVISSLGFALTSAVVAVTTLADVMAVQWWGALDATMLRSFVTQIDEGRYLATQVVLGVIAAWVLKRAAQPLDVAFAAIALAIAVTLPGYTGHSATAVTHWVASATMVGHLLAMSVWVGAVAVLWLAQDVEPLRRFGTVATVAVVLLLASGVASVLARTNDWGDFLNDPYALVLGAKLVLTALLLGVAARARGLVRATDAQDEIARSEAIARTLGIEVALMASVIAVAVVLARMANP